MSEQLNPACPVSPESLSPSFLSIVVPADLPAEGSVEQSLAEGDEKKKQQRRGRKKSKLEDMFPAYLQVGLRLPGSRKGRGCTHGRQNPLLLTPSAGSLLWEGTAGPESEGPVCSWGRPARLRTGNCKTSGGWRLR